VDHAANEVDAYHNLCGYTLTLGDMEFIHQHVVDAWAAQHATAQSKPIGVFFGLIGLHLHLERGFTGREVQRAHMKLARAKNEWPTFRLPVDRGDITAIDVMKVAEGDDRARAIDIWCASVWAAFESTHVEIRRAAATL
jgi:hypothetical protein